MLGLVWRRLLSDGDLQLASLEPLQGRRGARGARGVLLSLVLAV